MRCSMVSGLRAGPCSTVATCSTQKPVVQHVTAIGRAHRTFRVTTHASSKAKEEFEAELATESIDQNILDYCSLDPQGKRPTKIKSLGEKEQDYLDALRAFYYDGEPTMSNEEFDNLEQELLWEGSRVAILSPTEQRFMEATRAFNEGKPVLSDEQYDELKKQLRRDRSTVVAQGPRCSIRSKKMYSDITVDYAKMTALNIPAVLLVLGVLFSIDDITCFEITRAIELPQPWGIIFVWGIVLPSLFILANALTQLAFRDALIVKGICPNCLTENTTYFGDILTVAGNREESTIKCSDCKSSLKFNADERMLTLIPDDDSTGKGKPEDKKPAQREGEQKPAAA